MKSHLGVSAFAETYTYVFNRRGFNLEKSFMLLSSVFFVLGGGGAAVLMKISSSTCANGGLMLGGSKGCKTESGEI